MAQLKDTSTGIIQSGSGSVSAPSVSFIEHPQNGFYLPNTNEFAVGMSGSQKLRVDSTGNVGIGSNNTLDTLNVNGTVRCGSQTEPQMIIRDSDENIRAFKFYFNVTKNTGLGVVSVYDFVTINFSGNFYQAFFTVEYGARFQGGGDSTTRAVMRQYGLNRFNAGSLNVTNTAAITGDSTTLSNGLVSPIILSNTSYKISVEFSGSVRNASFIGGVIRGYGVAGSLGTNITFSNGIAE